MPYILTYFTFSNHQQRFTLFKMEHQINFQNSGKYGKISYYRNELWNGELKL